MVKKDEYYTIEIKNHVERIPYRDVLYILKDGKYAVFHLQSGKTMSVRKTLSQISNEISQAYFYFADRGCIINLANVVGIDKLGIILPDHQRITISKGSMSEFKTTMLRFWGKQI